MTSDEALKLAEALENDAKEHREVSYGLDCPPERTANWKHALNCEAAARLIRETLAEQSKCACDSPAWCTKYKKCNREMLGLPKAQPVKQEPVNQKAVGCYYGAADHIGHVVRIDVEIPIETLLYAAPVSAKREWVDLTDDEIYDALAEVRFVRDNLLDGCRALIAAFKEKNK